MPLIPSFGKMSNRRLAPCYPFPNLFVFKRSPMNTTILKATMVSFALMMSASASAGSVTVYDSHSGSKAAKGDFTIYNMTSATVSLDDKDGTWSANNTDYSKMLVNGKATIDPYSGLQNSDLSLELKQYGSYKMTLVITIQEPTLNSGQTLVNNPNYQGNSYKFNLVAPYGTGPSYYWEITYDSTQDWKYSSQSTSGAQGFNSVNTSQIYNSSYVVSLLSCQTADSADGIDGDATGNSQIVLLINPNFPDMFSQNAAISKMCPIGQGDKDNQAQYNKF